MRRQTVTFGAAGVVGALLALALVVMVNWLGARHYARADWTSSKVYTLSEKTENILSDLDQDIRVVVFMTFGSPLYDQVRELLDRYAAVSDHVQVEFIDPDREPIKTRQLAEEFGISVADTVVFTVGDRSKYVTSDQIVEYDYSGMQFGQGPQLRAFTGEEQFTSAILSLVAPSVPKVYFVIGHGEASLGGGGGLLSDRGLSALDELLRRENIAVENLELFGGEVPEDADVVAILGPTQAFTEAEIEALAAYLDRGGRLFVALDPLITSAGEMRATGLEGFLEDRGVRVRDDLVVDPQRGIQGYDASTLYLGDYGEHPVTRGLEGIATLFMYTRSLEPLSDDDHTVTSLVETSSEGWGETALAALVERAALEKEDADASGPLTVAVAVELEAPEAVAGDVEPEDGEPAPDAGPEVTGEARLVVVGDADFLTDSVISNLGNLTFTLNAFNWLAQREQSLGIPPRQVDQVSLFLTQQQLRTILLITLIAMPGAAILLGLLVWRRRRH
jgi:ABC-type uncharacterized transport system involved in gliding motility auxiliary subunit